MEEIKAAIVDIFKNKISIEDNDIKISSEDNSILINYVYNVIYDEKSNEIINSIGEEVSDESFTYLCLIINQLVSFQSLYLHYEDKDQEVGVVQFAIPISAFVPSGKKIPNRISPITLNSILDEMVKVLGEEDNADYSLMVNDDFMNYSDLVTRLNEQANLPVKLITDSTLHGSEISVEESVSTFYIYGIYVEKTGKNLIGENFYTKIKNEIENKELMDKISSAVLSDLKSKETGVIDVLAGIPESLHFAVRKGHAFRDLMLLKQLTIDYISQDIRVTSLENIVVKVLTSDEENEILCAFYHRNELIFYIKYPDKCMIGNISTGFSDAEVIKTLLEEGGFSRVNVREYTAQERDSIINQQAPLIRSV